MIFPLLCFSPDLDTFFCLFTSKKGHSYEKNSDLQFHSILQTTRDSREEKKIFHVVQLKSYFFFVHPLRTEKRHERVETQAKTRVE